MADDKRDAIKAAAASYRASLVSTGAAHQRATAEAAKATQLESKAASLRSDAKVNDEKATRRMTR